MKKIINCAVIAGSALAIPLALVAGPSGEAIGFTCAGCHGTDGVSQGIVPSIKGEDEKSLRSELMEFKSGEEQGTIMNRIVKGYTDEEIAAVAKYFANLK